MEIDAQKQLAIDLILLGEKKTDIALKVGVKRTTLYEWMKNPDFKAQLDAQRKDIISQADNYITSKIKTYIDKLDEIAIGKDNKLAATACMYLLDRVLGKAASKIEVKPMEDEEKTPDKVELENEFNRFRKDKIIMDINQKEAVNQ